MLITVGRSITSNEKAEIAKVLGNCPEVAVKLIPKNKPRTKVQLDALKVHWPMSFHNDVKLEATLDGSLFRASDISRLAELFFRVEKNKSLQKKNDSDFIFISFLGALFYDPKEDKIVSEGVYSEEKPLFHPIMAAIESLSRSQSNQHRRTQYLATGDYFHILKRRSNLQLGPCEIRLIPPLG